MLWMVVRFHKVSQRRFPVVVKTCPRVAFWWPLSAAHVRHTKIVFAIPSRSFQGTHTQLRVPNVFSGPVSPGNSDVARGCFMHKEILFAIVRCSSFADVRDWTKAAREILGSYWLFSCPQLSFSEVESLFFPALAFRKKKKMGHPSVVSWSDLLFCYFFFFLVGFLFVSLL